MPRTTTKQKIIFLLILGIFLLPLSYLDIQAGSADVPDRPTNLLAHASSPTRVDLFWNPPVDDGGSPITGYKIEVREGGGSYSILLPDTGNATTKYTHIDLTTNVVYTYKIYSINAVGISDNHSEDVATPRTSSQTLESIVPNAPPSLTALDLSPTSIKLTWLKPLSNNGPPLIGYKIIFKEDSGSFSTLIANTLSTGTLYTHSDLTTDTKYTYRVFAVNTIGNSTASNESFATPKSTSSPPSENIAPNPPRSLKAVHGSPTTIILSWNEPSSYNGPGVTGYEIEYKTSGNYTKLPATGITKSFVHSELIEGTQYTYRIFAINSIGASSPSNTASATPAPTLVPTNLIADDISPSEILLTWNAPSETFGSITGYTIREELAPNVYYTIKDTSGQKTIYTVTSLTTDEQYTYIVKARYNTGTSSGFSNEASATPTEFSEPPSLFTISGPPRSLIASAVSPIQVNLSWDPPRSDGGSPVTGYRIDVKVDDGDYVPLKENTGKTSRTYSHTERTPDTKYSYKVYALNSIGTSGPSNESSATPTTTTTEPTPKEKPGPPTSVQATVISQSQINLSWKSSADDGGDSITGYKIEVKEGTGSYKILTENTGKNTKYTHLNLKSDTTYQYRIFAINSVGTSILSSQTSTITIEDELEPNVPNFVEPEKGAQYYLDRYNNEVAYKDWFDVNFPDYTIQDAIELAIPDAFSEDTEKPILPFVDPNKDPQYYVDRYNSDASYKEWFDTTYPDYTIEEGVGLELEEPEEVDTGLCGPGTKWIDGYCIAETKSGGGCLIATATYGSELSPQVQELRELRDNYLLKTQSGSSFMSGFNEFYYSFSPGIADLERESPVFREAVKIAITPLITSLSVLNYVDMDSEAEVLGYGISLIILNVGMYVVAPVGIGLILVRRKKI